eukprot:2404874-Rhodomonas_salina.2
MSVPERGEDDVGASQYWIRALVRTREGICTASALQSSQSVLGMRFLVFGFGVDLCLSAQHVLGMRLFSGSICTGKASDFGVDLYRESV